MSKCSKKQPTSSHHVSDSEKGHREPQPASRKAGFLYRPLFHLLLIIIVGFIAYSNTFHVPFVFDDNPNIAENPLIKNFRYVTELSKAKELFSYILSNNRSIGYLTFALNYALHGPDVSGYHVVNLAVHVINALLLYVLVLLTFQTPILRTPDSELRTYFIALFSALLFVSHPIQTQAVTYIVQRLTSLATLFYLLSLVLYIKFRMKNTEVSIQSEEKQRKLFPLRSLWYTASVVSAILAMKTKEIAFTLPVIIALYEFMFFEGESKKRILYLIPFLLTMLIIPFALLGTDKPIGDLISDVSEKSRVQTAMSRWDYLFTQFRVIITYLRLLVFPANQNLDYDYPVYHSFLDLAVLLSFLLLSLLLFLAVYLLYRSFQFPTPNPQPRSFQPPTPSSSPTTIHQQLSTASYLRLISFGIFWFFITLSVESSIIPIADVIFEHRLYIPLIGFAIAFSIVFVAFLKRFLHNEIILITLIIVTTAIVTATTYSRNNIWSDDVTLFEDVAKKSPGKARVHINLGAAYDSRGASVNALSHFETALKINPNSVEAHINLGKLYDMIGFTDMAIEHLRTAIQIRPNAAMAYNNLGICYARKGDRARAFDMYSKAISIDPALVTAYSNRGNTLDEMGQPLEALEDYGRAITLNPYYAAVYYDRGLVYNRLGHADRAVADFHEACELGFEPGCEASTDH